jgi:hypothetical protein
MNKNPALLFAWIILAVAAPVLAIAALYELLRYSPYEDPGALPAGVWLGLAAILDAAIAIVLLLARPVRGAIHGYSAWRHSLTPGERAALSLAEAAAMTAAHEAWRHHNGQVSARLTRSVMGDGQDGPE